jgi:hypothetical protein
LSEELDRGLRHSSAEVWKEAHWPTVTQGPDDAHGRTRGAPMNHLDASRAPVRVHPDIERGVVAFAHDDGGAEAKLGDSRSEELERPEVSAHEHGPTSLGERTNQSLARFDGDRDPIKRPDALSPKKDARCQVFSGVREARACDAGCFRRRQAARCVHGCQAKHSG